MSRAQNLAAAKQGLESAFGSVFNKAHVPEALMMPKVSVTSDMGGKGPGGGSRRRRSRAEVLQEAVQRAAMRAADELVAYTFESLESRTMLSGTTPTYGVQSTAQMGYQGTSINYNVGEFNVTHAEASPSYAAMVNWGDGTQSAATLSLTSGIYTITAPHQYAQAGPYVVVTELTDSGAPAAVLGSFIDIRADGNLSQLQKASSYTITINGGGQTTYAPTESFDPGSGAFSISGGRSISYVFLQSLNEDNESTSPGYIWRETAATIGFTFSVTGTAASAPTVNEYSVSDVANSQLTRIESYQDLNDQHVTTLGGAYSYNENRTFDAATGDYTYTFDEGGDSLSVTDHGLLPPDPSGHGGQDIGGLGGYDGLTRENASEEEWLLAQSGLIGTYTATGLASWDHDFNEVGNFASASFTRTETSVVAESLHETGSDYAQTFTQTYTPGDSFSETLEVDSGSYSVHATDNAMTGEITRNVNIPYTSGTITANQSTTQSGSGQADVTLDKTGTLLTGDYGQSSTYSLSTTEDDSNTFTATMTDASLTQSTTYTGSENYTDTNQGDQQAGTYVLSGSLGGDLGGLISVETVSSNAPQTITSDSTLSPSWTLSQNGQMYAGAETLVTSSSPTNTVISKAQNQSQTNTATNVESPAIGMNTTETLSNGHYTSSLTLGGGATINSTGTDTAVDIISGSLVTANTSATETDDYSDIVIATGSDVTGSYTATETDLGESVILSMATNQNRTESATEIDNPNTTITTLGDLTGLYTTTETDYGDSKIYTTTTSQATNALTGASVTATAQSTETDNPSDVLAERTISTWRQTTGFYTITDIDLANDTISSSDTNQSASDSSSETDTANTTITTTGNHVLGAYTTTDTAKGSGNIQSTATNTVTNVLTGGLTTASSSENDTYSSNVTTNTTGNEISGTYSGASTDKTTDSIVGQSSDQSQTSNTTGTYMPTDVQTFSGNSLSTSSSWTETDGGVNSVVSHDTNIAGSAVDSLTVTDVDHVSLTSTYTGNAVTGSYTTSGHDYGISTISSTETNQGQKTSVTEIDKASGSTSVSTGNDIAGGYHATGVNVGINTTWSTATEIAADQNGLLVTVISSGLATDSLHDTTFVTGNPITGDYTNDEYDDGTLTTYASGTNQSLFSSSSGTDLPDAIIFTTGNDIAGNFTSTVTDLGTGTGSSYSNDHGQITTATNGYQDNNVIKSSGNDIAGDYTIAETDGGLATVHTSTTNNGQVITSNTTDTPNAHVNTTGNNITGYYNTSVTDQQTDSSDALFTNNTQTTSTTDTDNVNNRTHTTGSAITGDYSLSETVGGNDTVNVNAHNLNLTNDSVELDFPGTTITGNGNDVSGAYTTKEVDNGFYQLFTTVSNQTLLSSATVQDTASLTTNTTGNHVTGDFTTTTVDTSTAINSGMSTNLGQSVIMPPEFSNANVTTGTSGNDISGAYNASTTDQSTATSVKWVANGGANTSETDFVSNNDQTFATGNLVTGDYTRSGGGTDITTVNGNGTANGPNGNQSYVTTGQVTVLWVDSNDSGNTFIGNMNGVIHATTIDHTVTTNNYGDTGDGGGDSGSGSGDGEGSADAVGLAAPLASPSLPSAVGSDSETLDETLSSAETTTGNSITGAYTNSTNSTDTTTLSESGSFNNSFTLTSSGYSSAVITQIGNSFSGVDNTTTSSTDSSTLYQANTDASGYNFNFTQIDTSSGTVTTAANDFTGAYNSSTANGQDTLSNHEVDTSSGGSGQNMTLDQTITTTSSMTQNGNTITGDYTSTDHQGIISNLTQSGTDLSGTYSLSQHETDAPTVVTNGNSVDDTEVEVETGAQNYTIRQSNTNGSNNYTLSESGVNTYSNGTTQDNTDGSYSGTGSGSDTYNISQSGVSGSKSYTQNVNGTDNYTSGTIGNSQSGQYQQSTMGMDLYTVSEHGTIAGTPFSTGPTVGSQALGTTQSGNSVDGSIGLSDIGDRYSLLEQFNNPSDGANGGPGLVGFSSVGTMINIVPGAVVPTGSFASTGDIFHKYCFAKGTQVLLADGSAKAIETIEPGTLVLASPDSDPEATPKPCRVVEVYHNEPAKLLAVTIHLHDQPIDPEPILTTANHPFYVRGKGWTNAATLQAGDALRTADSSWANVRKISDTGRMEPVFNLQVEGGHTYFVKPMGSVHGVLVHNQSVTAGDPAAGFTNYPKIATAGLNRAATATSAVPIIGQVAKGAAALANIAMAALSVQEQLTRAAYAQIRKPQGVLPVYGLPNSIAWDIIRRKPLSAQQQAAVDALIMASTNAGSGSNNPTTQATQAGGKNVTITLPAADAASMAKNFAQGQATRPIFNYKTGQQVGEITVPAEDRVIRYPHTDSGTPQLHWNLVDKKTGVNIHVVIQ